MKHVFRTGNLRNGILRGMMLAVVMGVAVSAHAAKSDKKGGGDSGAATPESGLYLSLYAAQFFPNGNEPNNGNLDSTMNYILGVGYLFNENFAIEYDASEPLDNQNGYHYTVTKPVLSRGDFEYRTQSLFGVFRTSGQTYFKAKLGATYEDFFFKPGQKPKPPASPPPTPPGYPLPKELNDSTGLYPAAGAGIGFRNGPGLFEIEYTLMKNNYVDIGSFSMGLTIVF